MIEQIKKYYNEGNDDIFSILDQMTNEEIEEIIADLAKEDLSKYYDMIGFLDSYTFYRSL